MSSSQTFEFVNLSQGPRQDAETRRRVRSYAMREVRRRKAPAFIGDAQGSSPGTIPKFKQDVALRSRNRDHRDYYARPSEKIEWFDDSQEEDFSDFLATDTGIFPNILGEEYVDDWISIPRLNRKRSRADRANATITTSSKKTLSLPKPVLTAEDISGKGSSLNNMLVSPWAGRFDPFNALPVANTERLRILVHHYTTVLPWIPWDPKDGWFSNALTDGALFRAVLLISAAHHNLQQGTIDLSECLLLRDEITHMINERLADSERATNDATIATVIYLACFEIVVGNASATVVHLSGAQQMVELRGGLRALGMQGHLQRLISWADVCGATLTLSAPRFPLIRTSNADRVSVTTSQVPAEFTGLSERQEGLKKIFQEMRQLSGMLLTLNIRDKDPAKALFGQEVYITERQLLLLSVSGDPLSTTPTETFINQSLRSAAFVYMYAVLREVPIISILYDTLVKRLRSALDHAGFMLAWSHTQPTLLLWVLAVGGTAAFARPERPWFVNQMVGLSAILELRTMKDLERALRETMWVAGPYDHSFRALWLEIEIQCGSGH